MIDWFQGLNLAGQIFVLVAVPSTIILLIQTIMSFFSGTADDAGLGSDVSGLSGGGDIDLDLDVAAPDDFVGGDPQSFDDAGLQLFSTRSIIAFLTVGGWTGVICIDAGLAAPLSVLIAFAAGCLALFGTAKLMQALMRLQESGSYSHRQGLGKQAQVYLTIPPEGTGKITLMLGDSLGEFTARSSSKTQIKTGALVRVVDLVGDTFVVEEIGD